MDIPPLGVLEPAFDLRDSSGGDFGEDVKFNPSFIDINKITYKSTLALLYPTNANDDNMFYIPLCLVLINRDTLALAS